MYIIAYPYIGSGTLETVEPDKKMLIHLQNALEKMRGNHNFAILYCPLQKNFDDFDNIYIRTIINPSNDARGDFNCWNQILYQFPFTLEKIEVDNSQMDNTFDEGQ